MTQLGSAPKRPTQGLVRAVEEHLGKKSRDWRKPHTGLTPAQRFAVRMEDGSSVFVKAAVDAETERWLRTDHRMMTTVQADLVPDVIAWIEAGPESILVLEDLHDAHWPADHSPVLWKPEHWTLLFAALERLAATKAPSSLPSLTDGVIHRWPQIAADPQPFLDLGLCTKAWLEHSVEALTRAGAGLDLSGDSLVHNDVRSDNVCFRGERVIFVDWSDARRGSARHDLANVLGGCQLEGGPDPYEIMPDGAPFAAWRAADLWWRAVYEPSCPTWLLAVFRRATILNLQWAAKCLALPAWDGVDWRDI